MKNAAADNSINSDGQKNGVLHKKKDLPQIVLIILLVSYLAASILLTKVGRLEGTINILDVRIPYSIFTGVFSSIANICIIFMVVFFKKMGFITSMILLVSQIPMILMSFFTQHTPASLPGLFNDLLTLVAVILIYRRNKKIAKFQQTEVEYFKTQQRFSQRLFEQTATALVNAIDAKDAYSHGHSIRVAEYSEKIARMLGKSDEECYKIYYTALLHDVGKIGIPNSIINKKGRLNDEEYEVIKNHPVMGNQILSSISEYPYLSIGAHFHHERYDGRGYPDRLKGDDIPEIARIISVADAYDAMSSNRSYRDAIPQQLVREEIVKGAGTQFDPKFAKVMQRLIDLDVEYKMKERKKNGGEAERNELVCQEYRSEVSDGILVIPFMCKIRFKFTPEVKSPENIGEASLILFDSLDGRIHDEEKTIKELYYFEYCEIWLDGRVSGLGVRNVEKKITESKSERKKDFSGCTRYEIEAVKRKDHALIRIDDGSRMIEVIVALPNASRYVYLGVTGQNCRINEFTYKRSPDMIGEDYIPRIAPKISYIDKPEGDIPNVQVDGYRSESTEGVLLKNKVKFSFHTMSLPTARLIWHCPFVAIFSSKNGKFNGEDYKEYAAVRLDGEVLENGNGLSDNKLNVEKSQEFGSWDLWKENNKKGYDSVVTVERVGNVITTTTENLGISVSNVTTVLENIEDIYVALTGDQCALTGINVSKQ